jgi:5-azacytidine-induced protein 1
LRREAWEKEKVREIKEMTIKGLEPEVQRILSEHKAEKRRMEESQAQTMEGKVRELEASHAELLSAQKSRFLAELDDRLTREREWFRGKSREEYERSLKQVAEERSKAAAERAALERTFEEQRQQDRRDHGGACDQVRLQEAKIHAERLAVVNEKVETLKRQHAAELLALQEQLTTEKAQWQSDVAEKISAEFATKEEVLRTRLVRERDEQLDALMRKLGEDHMAEAAELRRAAEEHNAAADDKLAAAEARIAQLAQDLVTAGEERSELDKAHTRLQARILDLEAQKVEEARKGVASETKLGAVLTEFSRTKELHQQEKAAAVQVAEAEAVKIRQEVARLTEALASAQQQQRDHAQRTKEREEETITEVEARVRRALAKKDETAAALHAEIAARDMKIASFEELLSRQRDELLGDL